MKAVDRTRLARLRLASQRIEPAGAVSPGHVPAGAVSPGHVPAGAASPGDEVSATPVSAAAAATPVSAADVVRWMTAMQAQDLPGALWSVALRMPGGTREQVIAAFQNAEVVRSWPFRGTLHLVPGVDLGWMLDLTAARTIAGAATRHRGLGLDAETFDRARGIAERALEGGRALSRTELFAAFDAGGVSTAGQRGVHLLWYLSHTKTLCFGPMVEPGRADGGAGAGANTRAGGQGGMGAGGDAGAATGANTGAGRPKAAGAAGPNQALVLLDEWVGHPRRLERDESLGELALRYFRSHGPATLKDFLWWSKVLVKEAKTGLELAAPELESFEIDGIEYWMAAGLPDARPSPSVHLLPGFDEYLLGYTDRSAALDEGHFERIVPGGNGMFSPTLVVNGRVVGTWARKVSSKAVTVTPEAFADLSSTVTKGVSRASGAYADYLGLPLASAPSAGPATASRRAPATRKTAGPSE